MDATAARNGANSDSRGTHTEGERVEMMPLQGLEEPQLQQQQMHMRQLAQQTRGPWVKYYIQRITTHINHVLFYVVDPAGNARLAVVGTDVKLSGHFVYASVSDMPDCHPLRCTNRQKVLEWLGALGAVELAEDHEVTLPQLSETHWQQLHSSNPMLLKPKLDRNYTSWREDSGVMADGRHFKHFLLVDPSTGGERMAVIGEDSARQDRRYTYKACDDLGGFCFENCKAVQDWLDFVCGRTQLPPSQMSRARPAGAERKRGRRKRTAGGTTEDDTDQELAGAYTHQHGRALNAPSASLIRFGSGGLPPHGPGSMYSAAQLGPQPIGGPYDQHTMGTAAPLLPPMGHYGPGGPLQQVLGPQGAAAAAGGLLPPGAAAAPALPPEPVDVQEAVRAAGEEVRQLFAVGGQQLLTFVTHVPNSGSIELVCEMAHRLNSFVDALGLTGAPGSSEVDVPEVMGILRFLADRPASLKLLETTSISRPVALLGCMHEVLAAQGQQLRPDAARDLQPVALLAQQLAGMWLDLAAAAHKLSHEALEASPAPLMALQ